MRPISESAKVLTLLRQLVESQKTNAYQVAKGAKVSLSSVQNLLAGKAHPTLINLETIIAAMGYEIRLAKRGDSLVKPGTGRGHGPTPGKRRGKG
jgi:DNA-binding phage protein